MIDVLKNEKAFRFFQFSIEAFCSYCVLREMAYRSNPEVSHRIKGSLKTRQPPNLLGLTDHPNLFENHLLMYGYALELLLKSMCLYKGKTFDEVIKYNHKIKLLLFEVANLYSEESLKQYEKMVGDPNLESCIEW